jgi:PAS domain S-box-containing protein
MDSPDSLNGFDKIRENNIMNIKYFQDTDTLLIILNNNEIYETKQYNKNITYSVDKSGQLIKFVVENAKKINQLDRLIENISHNEDTRLTQKLQKANKKLLSINDSLHDKTTFKQNLSFESPISQFGERLINAFGNHMLASGGSLYMVERDGLRLVHALDPGHAPVFIPFPLKENSVLEYLMSAGKPLLIHDLKEKQQFTSSGWNGYLDDSVLAFPIPDENGHIVGLLSFHSRVSPKFEEHDKDLGTLLTHFTSETLRAVKATYALQESQERLRLIMEATNDGIWDWNPITNDIYFSPRWFTLLGYQPDTLPHTYETFQQLLHPDDKNRLDHFFCNQLESKKTFSIAFRMKTNDGSWLWVESRGKVMEWDKFDKAMRVMGTLSDISERKASEIELFRHSQALQQSLDGIVIANMSGQIEFVNAAWASMHGYTTTELVGKDLYIFMPPPQQSNFSKFMAQAQNISGIIREDKHLTKNGKYFSIRLSSSVLKEPCDQAIGLILIARDITEERKIEAQLLQAQKMESIGRIAGGIAHDFNNLLTPILANTQMVISDPSISEDHRSRLERVLVAAERASDLTRQILVFSKKQKFELQTFYLAEIVEGFYNIMSSIIREDIQFSIDTKQSKGYIHADVSHIEQILMNILVNAQDAMPKDGKLEIIVCDTILDETYTEKNPNVTPGPYVMIIISDTGIGMSRMTLKQAFEPFYTTKEEGKRSGLGLSIVYGIIKQHGGHIHVHSIENRGTTFKLYFPRVEKQKDEPPGIYPPKQTGGHETILVAEDEDIVRELVCTILKRLGYHVLDARDANHCLKIVSTYDGPIHLLVSDVVMPGMNGKELYLNLVKQYPDIKVLFMSGYTEDIIIDRGIISAPNEFLQKPISVQKLAEAVNRILNEKKSKTT